MAWAGTNSGPVVAWNDDPPINSWLDIVNLLERLAPEHPLLPADCEQRIEVVGLSNEICGELGLGWNRRLSLYQPAISAGQAAQALITMGQKYRYNDADVARTAERQIATLQLLAQHLASQHARGSDYFVGDSVSAVDFYWAAFSTIYILPPAQQVPIEEDRRPMFEYVEPAVKAALVPALMAHRDRMLQQHFKLPMEF
jgi:glutathione S-transferase